MAAPRNPTERLIERARGRGARGVAVLHSARATREAVNTRGKWTIAPAVREDLVDLRVWAEGGAQGRAVGPASDEDALIEQALAAAAVGAPDPHGGPVGRLGNPLRGLMLEDQRWDALTDADRLEVVADAERAARAVDKRVRTEAFHYTERREVRSYGNSRGVLLQEPSTRFVAGGTVRVADDAGEMVLTEQIEARAFSSLVSVPFGHLLAERGLAMLQGKARPEGAVRVALSGRLVAALFSRLVDLALSGGDTFLRRGRLDPRVNVLDDGSLPGFPRTRAFDDEGVAPVPVVILRDGRVESPLLDVRAARERGVRPTGHVDGVALTPSNLLIRGGTRSINAVLCEIEAPVFVAEHLHAWDRWDPVTGEVALRVGGPMTRRSKREGVVRDVRLSGLLPKVLNAVVEVASDTDRYGTIDAPMFVVDGFTATPG